MSDQKEIGEMTNRELVKEYAQRTKMLRKAFREGTLEQEKRWEELCDDVIGEMEEREMIAEKFAEAGE